MRRYYFDLWHGDNLANDEEGMDLPDIDAVQKMAVRVLADMAQDLIDLPAPIAVEVRDEAGPVMRVRCLFEIERTN
jgi:hypothetical protein